MAEERNLKSESEGIKVHGDDAYSPYRFQDFEVTPKFRQQVLEAPLPLLDLRDLNLDPSTGPRPRAGANDITQPELPLPRKSPGTELGQVTTKLRVRRKSSLIPKALLDGTLHPKRGLILAGALGIIFLGMALAHLNAGPPIASPKKSVDPAVDVPLLPIESTHRVANALENSGPQVPSPAPAAAREQSTKASQKNAPGITRPIAKPHALANRPPQAAGTLGHSSKTLWLPIE